MQCGDEGPEGPDGEGGSDEALFNMVTARLCGIEEENAYQLPVLGEVASFGSHEAVNDETFDKQVASLSEGAIFEEINEELEADPDEQQPARGVNDDVTGEDDEDSALRELYTKGFDLLVKLGWTRGSPIGLSHATVNPVPNGSEIGWDCGDFRGLGSVGTRSQQNRESSKDLLDRKFRQVHNATAGHMGEVRTYRRLRQLPGFPWDLKTSEVQEFNRVSCKNCLLCNKVWKLRGEPQRAQGSVI